MSLGVGAYQCLDRWLMFEKIGVKKALLGMKEQRFKGRNAYSMVNNLIDCKYSQQQTFM